MGEKKDRKKLSIFLIVEDIIFYIIVIPLVLITAVVLCQSLIQPEKIPDVFGYKMFMVLDGNMDTSIEYGDLVFTKNMDADRLKINDVIAFRNKTNKVTIHRISEIEETDENIIFTMITASNEVGDTKFVEGHQVEGLLIYRIPRIGLIILFLQEPPVMAFIVCVILIIGLIIYYIAQELDKRDAEKLKELNEIATENPEASEEEQKELDDSIK